MHWLFIICQLAYLKHRASASGQSSLDQKSCPDPLNEHPPAASLSIAVFFGLAHCLKAPMKILHVLGALLIVSWLFLWLALKLTFVAIHALLVLGVILIIVAFIAGRSAGSKS
jgi:hypothetical protein